MAYGVMAPCGLRKITKIANRMNKRDVITVLILEFTPGCFFYFTDVNHMPEILVVQERTVLSTFPSITLVITSMESYNNIMIKYVSNR